MNRKYIIIAIILCMVLSLCLLSSCQDNNSGDKGTESESESVYVTETPETDDEESATGESNSIESSENTESNTSDTSESDTENDTEDNTESDTDTDNTESDSNDETEDKTESETDSSTVESETDDNWGMGPVMP